MSQNARIIEKNMLEGVNPIATGSGVIDLFGHEGGANKFSCQMVATTNVDKTFDSPTLAHLTNQSLTYTATVGYIAEAGNDITIELVNTGIPDQALEIDVTDSAITVNLELDSGTESSLVVQDLTYTAQEVGIAGDGITIKYLGDGTAGAETVTLDGQNITVHMDPTVLVGSTADDISDAIIASVAASLLVSVAVTGTGATVQTTVAETPLAGGADPAIVTTGNALKTAINADTGGAADLVLVTGTNAAVVTAFGPTNLAGGIPGEVNVSESSVTIPAHGYATGFKVTLSTTGTLPGGLAVLTNYYIINIDYNTVQFASSLMNAQSGTAITLTTAGSPNAVATVLGSSVTGCSLKFQKSNSIDGPWITFQTESVAGPVSALVTQPNVCYRYFKVVKAITGGQADIKALVLVIGDAE